MKSIKLFLISISGLLLMIASCKGKTDSETSAKNPNIFFEGVVNETMDSNGYTYALIKKASDKYLWVAAPALNVSIGEKVSVPHGSIMENFTSPTLKKTFPHILFVNSIYKTENGESQALNPTKDQPYCPPKAPAPRVDAGSIQKAGSGYTVKECYVKSNQLTGKAVVVRGKVIKFSQNIMGRNWIHLSDGSGTASNNDLTITTNDRTEVGRIITISGVLAKDKDIGAGYHFPVIIENASIIAE